jgi:hypothetical protein
LTASLSPLALPRSRGRFKVHGKSDTRPYEFEGSKEEGGHVAMSSGLAAFTLFHVVLSLAGIFTGFVFVFGLFSGKVLNGWTATFLATTLLTSVTGFLFPFHKLLPSHVLGILSLIALGLAYFALYGRGLAGRWRASFVVSAVIALYFNVFVLIAQLFGKVPALRALAPTQTEGPFKLTQLAVLLLFVVLGILAVTRSRGHQLRTV